METDICEATPADIPQLCQLLGILFSQEVDFAADVTLQERGLSMIISNPDVGRILVLRDGDRVLGMANLLFTVSTAMGARVAVLEDVIVLPEYRGKGFGRQLLNASVSLARECSCERVTLLTDSDNFRAQKLYTDFGFKPSTMMPMRLLL